MVVERVAAVVGRLPVQPRQGAPQDRQLLPGVVAHHLPWAPTQNHPAHPPTPQKKEKKKEGRKEGRIQKKRRLRFSQAVNNSSNKKKKKKKKKWVVVVVGGLWRRDPPTYVDRPPHSRPLPLFL